MSTGSLTLLHHFFEKTHAIYFSSMNYAYWRPKEIVPLGDISSPFSWTLWTYIAALLSAFALLFVLLLSVYATLDPDLVPSKPPVSTVVLFAFSKITEPDPLPWLARTSGGRACVFCWTLFCLVMILAYQSNLRAHMTTVRYGKPLNTLEDIVEHGKRVWIVTSILTQT